MSSRSLTRTDAAGKNARHAIGVHTVLIRDDGKVLLQKRSANVKLSPGLWCSPRGNLEADERAPQGAARELFEETGAVVNPADLAFASMTHFVNDTRDGPAFAIFFTATAWTGTPEVREPHKADKLAWFDPDELPEPIVPYVANTLADIRAGRPFSLFGWAGYESDRG